MCTDAHKLIGDSPFISINPLVKKTVLTGRGVECAFQFSSTLDNSDNLTIGEKILLQKLLSLKSVFTNILC